MAERAENQGKVLELTNKISSLKTVLSGYFIFASQFKSLVGENQEFSSLLNKFDLISRSIRKNLVNFEKWYFKDIKSDADLTTGMSDYIEFLQQGLDDESKRSALEKEFKNLELDCNIDDKSYDINLDSLKKIQKEITSNNSAAFKIAVASQKVAPSISIVNEALIELSNVNKTIDSYKNNYWKTTNAKRVVAELDSIYSSVYKDFSNIKNLLIKIADGDLELNDPQCEGITDAVNFLVGTDDYYDGENNQLKITTEVETQFKKNIFSKAELLTNVSNLDSLEAKLGEAKMIFDNLPNKYKKGTKENTIIKAAAIGTAIAVGLTGLAGAIYHGDKFAKEKGAKPYQDELHSQQMQEQDDIVSIRQDIQVYVENVESKITELEENSKNWIGRIGGEKAIESFETCKNSEEIDALNACFMNALAVNDISEAQKIYKESSSYYSSIMNTLTEIEESVGGFKDVEVAKNTINEISSDSLKSWQQAYTKSQTLAINISDIRTNEIDGEDSALVQIVFQKNNGEKYISEGEISNISEYYKDGELSAQDLTALLKDHKQGDVRIYKDFSSYFSSSDTVLLYGIDNVLSGRPGSSIEYIVYSPTGVLVKQGEVLYNNYSQQATKDMILQAVENEIYGQNEM